MAVSKIQLPLKNVAKQIRNVASATAPRKTGNLRNTLRTYNTPDRMVKFDDKGQAKITLYFAPPGAKYGRYWNKPFGSGSGTTSKLKKNHSQHFDYAEKAYNDDSVKRLMQKYIKAVGSQILTDLREAVRAN
jgi:hypothetical protein